MRAMGEAVVSVDGEVAGYETPSDPKRRKRNVGSRNSLDHAKISRTRS